MTTAWSAQELDAAYREGNIPLCCQFIAPLCFRAADYRALLTVLNRQQGLLTGFVGEKADRREPPRADKFCEVLLNRFAEEETRRLRTAMPATRHCFTAGHTQRRVLPLSDAIFPAGKQRAARKIRKERNCVLQFGHTRDILYIVTTDGDNLVPGTRLA